MLSSEDKRFIWDNFEGDTVNRERACNFKLHDFKGYKIATFDDEQGSLRGTGYVNYERSGNTHILKFDIPGSILGYDVIDLCNISRIAVHTYIHELKKDESVLLDFSRCNLSNIIWACDLFNFTAGEVVVKLPGGDKMLKPLATWKYSSEIINIDEVIKMTDFSDVISADAMLQNCSNVKEFDFTGKKFNNLADAEYMFAFCHELESIKFDNDTFCGSIRADSMFAGCMNLKSFNLDCFGDNSLENIANMFSCCIELESVTTTKGWSRLVSKNRVCATLLFEGCTHLTDVDVAGVLSVASSYKSSSNIFSCCAKLKMKDLRIVGKNIEFISESLMLVDRYVLDIRGTRVITGDKEVPISIIGYNNKIDKYMLNYSVLVLDKEQYGENKAAIDLFVDRSTATLMLCDNEQIGVTFMKLNCFGLNNVNGVMILVDTNYDPENSCEICG